VANSNRRNYTVDALAVNGSLSSDSTEIKEYVMKFYSQLYLEQFSWRPKLDGFYFNFIGEDEGWLVVKEDIMVVFKEFRGRRTFFFFFNFFMTRNPSKLGPLLGSIPVG
jgi:hypothetical protein